jgi:hypothetical protein
MTKVTDVINAASASGKVDFEAGRRAFIRSIGAGAAGVATLGLAGTASNQAMAQAVTDADILTFALNLEYLEAEFYLRAATGTGLAAADIGANPGPVTGGSKISFSSNIVSAYAQEIAAEEQKHVQFLRYALTAAGVTPVSRPTIDLQTSFTTAARAAGLIGNTATFNAFQNDNTFLLASYIFEDVGVTAYHGAAPLISNKGYLDAAAGILAVEAYHAGLIRTVLFVNGFAQQTQLISNLRAKLDGTYGTSKIDDFGVGTVGAPQIVNASNAANGNTIATNNAIAFDRTTNQVLNIVYGNTSKTPGLFFPNGMNGTIR